MHRTRHQVPATRGVIIDFQRNHTSLFLVDATTWKTNAAWVTANDLTLHLAGRGERAAAQ